MGQVTTTFKPDSETSRLLLEISNLSTVFTYSVNSTYPLSPEVLIDNSKKYPINIVGLSRLDRKLVSMKIAADRLNTRTYARTAIGTDTPTHFSKHQTYMGKLRTLHGFVLGLSRTTGVLKKVPSPLLTTMKPALSPSKIKSYSRKRKLRMLTIKLLSRKRGSKSWVDMFVSEEHKPSERLLHFRKNQQLITGMTISAMNQVTLNMSIISGSNVSLCGPHEITMRQPIATFLFKLGAKITFVMTRGPSTAFLFTYDQDSWIRKPFLIHLSEEPIYIQSGRFPLPFIPYSTEWTRRYYVSFTKTPEPVLCRVYHMIKNKLSQ
ncbi:unnamed protein product [Orchesella dallaii]|uniref:Uncharacterized protein n=1 Tax=Orchesella dallaii TaxID=48710 RepID=A0ABP1S5B4_9HEXA